MQAQHIFCDCVYSVPPTRTPPHIDPAYRYRAYVLVRIF